MKCRSEYIPFSNINDNQFDIAISKGVNYYTDFDLHTNLGASLQSIPDKIEIVVHNTEKASNDIEDGGTSDKDCESIEINPVSCKYYTVDDFVKLKPSSINNSQFFI